MSNARHWSYCEVVRTTRVVIVESSEAPPETDSLARVLAETALPALAPGLIQTGRALGRGGVFGKWGGMALTVAGLAVAGALAAGRRNELARALPGRALRALPPATGQGVIRALGRGTDVA